ncbi:hypothetical protein [Mangrovicoccus ximenensis]|uniref:hypothetical protein n=1 Tax=Mangrovicoccus ximenensis TaxID=1911570 RepID=UPI001374B91B|nr:hypothetical protein [Mangrovicoccus ximenensis]
MIAVLKEAQEAARQVIAGHQPQIRALVAELEAREVLDSAQIAACLGPKAGKPAD